MISRRDLARLIPMWPDEMQDRDAILAKLDKALVAERKRGLAGHWTYDLGLHNAMLLAYRKLVNGAPIE